VPIGVEASSTSDLVDKYRLLRKWRLSNRKQWKPPNTFFRLGLSGALSSAYRRMGLADSEDPVPGQPQFAVLGSNIGPYR